MYGKSHHLTASARDSDSGLCDARAKKSGAVIARFLAAAKRFRTLALLAGVSTVGTACSDRLSEPPAAPRSSPAVTPSAPAPASETVANPPAQSSAAQSSAPLGSGESSATPSATPSAPEALERFEATHGSMGIKFTIIGYTNQESVARAAVEAAFARIDELNDILSDYDPASESMRLSHEREIGQWHEVSPALLAMLQISREFSQQTQGAFDVTVGPLTKLWRVSRRSRELPNDQAIEAARAAVGWEKLELQSEPEAAARLAVAGMQLDFGGIAQGYAAEQAARILAEHGINRCLIDASGDVVALDSPPDRESWEVAVAPIQPGAAGSVTINLVNHSVSTSGDAFQFVEIGGRRYSHLIDPRTGWPIEGRSSVTVLAADGTEADALASALSIMPAPEALEWTEAHEGVEVLIVRVVDEEVRVERSSGFNAWVARENE